MSQEFDQNQDQEEDEQMEFEYKLGYRTELERDLDLIAKELKKKFQQGNLEEFLDDAIDIMLYVSLPSKEIAGFDIGLTTGNPNIRLVYSRGRCQLRGSWGSLNDEKDIDNEICETIFDYLSELSTS